MMLLYKAWLESRTRFLLSVLTLACLSTSFVLFNSDARAALADHNVTYADYIWKAIFKGHLRDIFVILTLMLGMGGLERERAYGTAAFTLALPIPRWRSVAARGFGGAIQTTALSFLPAVLVPALSPVVHESYSWTHALHFGVLWTTGGVLIFALGFLASVLFAGEYSAPIAAIAFLFAYSIAADLPGVERYIVDIHDAMNGTGPHGFKTLASLSATAVGMIALAAGITTGKDY
jgi:ABC-type transport system involved in multi-copper enzyme maturation permease subunit